MSDTDEQNAAGSDDKSQFIRTFAKDVASLTGKTPVTSAKAKADATTKANTADGVTLPTVEEPFFSVPQTTREVADAYRAPEALPSMADLSATASELTPGVQEVKVEGRKSELLDRLRKRVSENAQMDIQSAPVAVVPPAPEPPPPEPVVPPAPIVPPPPVPQPPVFVERREVVAPPLPPLVRPESQASLSSPLHTYKSDFADRIDAKGASAFSVLAAQQDAPRVRTAQTKMKGRTVALLAGGALLIMLGVGGVYGAYWYVARMNTLPTPLNVPSLVFADERVRLEGRGPELVQALANVANEPLVDGNVLVVYLSESTTTPKGAVREIPLTGGALIAALELPAPEILLRNISPVSTVGVVSASPETRPFFIFRVTSYERTFAGMLAWEETMGRDLAPFYPSYAEGVAVTEATTLPIATGTPVVASEPPRALLTFSDEVVANHDVRVLKDTAGNTLLLYGYSDKETLIIARDAAAFSTLLSRLAATRTQ